MDKVFQKFLRSGIDLSPVGVERREDNNPYFARQKVHLFWLGGCGRHPLLLCSRLWRYGIFRQSHELGSGFCSSAGKRF